MPGYGENTWQPYRPGPAYGSYGGGGTPSTVAPKSKYPGQAAQTGLGAAGAGLSGLASGMGQTRNIGNEFEANLARFQNENPNAPLEAGLKRNLGGNLRQNLSNWYGGLGPGGVSGLSGTDFMGGLADVYLQSATQGVNPMLQQESLNMGGVPGLGQNAWIRPDLKGPGILETLAGVGGSALGGLSSMYGG